MVVLNMWNKSLGWTLILGVHRKILINYFYSITAWNGNKILCCFEFSSLDNSSDTSSSVAGAAGPPRTLELPKGVKYDPPRGKEKLSVSEIKNWILPQKLSV